MRTGLIFTAVKGTVSVKEKYAYINELAAQNVPFLCIVDFEGAEVRVWPLDQLDANLVWFQIGTHQNRANSTTATLKQWQPQPLEYAEYDRAFQLVHYHLMRGDSFLTNLTASTPVKTNLTLSDLFEVSHARYKLWLKDEFVCFSPEPFVRIENGTIRSYPMKGTISAAIPHAQEQILNDEKETEEHVTIVDLIRNDLGRVASSVVVESFRYTELVQTAAEDLWQVSSCIQGQLLPDLGLGDILSELLPAGSISGAPKKRTVEIIREVETSPRGFFTGIVGLYDGEKFDSGVMIRFVQQTPNGLVYRSGGGITVNSDPKREYQEMIDKVYVPTF